MILLLNLQLDQIKIGLGNILIPEEYSLIFILLIEILRLFIAPSLSLFVSFIHFLSLTLSLSHTHSLTHSLSHKHTHTLSSLILSFTLSHKLTHILLSFNGWFYAIKILGLFNAEARFSAII